MKLLLFKKYRGFIIPLLFIVGIFLLSLNPADNRKNVPIWMLQEIKPDPGSLIDSSTPYVRYKKIIDSLESIYQWKKSRISDPHNSWSSLFFGMSDITECDSCNTLSPDEVIKKEIFKDKYFITLKDYTLNNDATFLIDKNKYFIKYMVWDTVYENGASGHPEIKECPVRFASCTNEFSQNDSYLLIPVSKTTYNVLNILMRIILICLATLAIGIILLFPCKVLYRIAMGRSFAIENIRNLRLTGWTIILMTLLPLVISWVVKLVLGHQLPHEIYFPAWLYLSDKKAVLVAGAIFLLLSSAFKRGHELQQEQDLTV